MSLTITAERFAEIRAKVMRRKFNVVSLEMTPHELVFTSVQDFFDYADPLVKPLATDQQRSRKR